MNYFLVSKLDSTYRFYETEFNGFEKLEGYGCFKKRPLRQMPDGRVFSITDGYFFNDSDLDCPDTRIINLRAGESISDEDVLITEHFFRDEVEFGR